MEASKRARHSPDGKSHKPAHTITTTNSTSSGEAPSAPGSRVERSSISVMDPAPAISVWDRGVQSAPTTKRKREVGERVWLEETVPQALDAPNLKLAAQLGALAATKVNGPACTTSNRQQVLRLLLACEPSNVRSASAFLRAFLFGIGMAKTTPATFAREMRAAGSDRSSVDNTRRMWRVIGACYDDPGADAAASDLPRLHRPGTALRAVQPVSRTHERQAHAEWQMDP